jgi:hypothetical protein
MYKKDHSLKKLKADTIESLKEKDMISMLQLLPTAMPFPPSSHSRTRYKALCTVCNHAYENKKNVEKKISNTTCQKICMENIDIFLF